MYDDSGHVPHANWKGTRPTTSLDYGPEGLEVRLLDWGPNTDTTFAALWAALQANWGEGPALMENNDDLSDGQWEYVRKAFSGGTLQQALERFSFSFVIDGCTRAATHQIVRTRLGAGFMQHGGRDNDWRHRKWTMPETIRRADVAVAEMQVLTGEEHLQHCVTDMAVLKDALENMGYENNLSGAIQDVVRHCKQIYAMLVDAGIPWQDARRVLPIGCQTYIFADYNYVGLKGVLANRLEHVMDWEINCIAQLMLREIWRNCPRMIAESFGSRSDSMGKAAFAEMDSWPPDLKYDATEEQKARARTHQRLQMPFFVLHPKSLRGETDDIIWTPTNGSYPTEDEFKIAWEVHNA